MKKGLLIGFFVFVFSLGVVSAACTDSDGLNYFEKGIISSEFWEHTDSCAIIDETTGSVAEYINECSADEWCSVIEYKCPGSGDPPLSYGQIDRRCADGCREGACIMGEDVCIDSDGGADIFVKGVSSGIMYLTEDYVDNVEDECDGDRLWEYHCAYVKEDNKYYLYLSSHECLESCEAGACVGGGCPKDTKVCPDETIVVRLLPECEFAQCPEPEAEPEPEVELGKINTCEDTDKLNIYGRGKISGYENGIYGEFEDKCILNPGTDDYVLQEGYCSERNVGSILTINCLEGCKDGACEGEMRDIPACLDSDGKNLHKKGKTTGPKFTGEERDLFSSGTYEDECISKGENDLAEYYCRDGLVVSETFDCPTGCEDGACITSGDVEDIPPVVECMFGCIFESRTCVLISYRKAGKYCSGNNEFVEQLEAGKYCDNSFECKSNVCVDSECISGGFLRKIIEWFRNLFG